MPTLSQATLTDAERCALDRFVELLQRELGDDLRAVWLYGSRARGEPPHPESDVDLLVVSRRARVHDLFRAIQLLHRAAEAVGADPVSFSIQLYEPERIGQRRAIRSFFMQEVDRDKIALHGEP